MSWHDKVNRRAERLPDVVVPVYEKCMCCLEDQAKYMLHEKYCISCSIHRGESVTWRLWGGIVGFVPGIIGCAIAHAPIWGVIFPIILAGVGVWLAGRMHLKAEAKQAKRRIN